MHKRHGATSLQSDASLLAKSRPSRCALPWRQAAADHERALLMPPCSKRSTQVYSGILRFTQIQTSPPSPSLGASQLDTVPLRSGLRERFSRT